VCIVLISNTWCPFITLILLLWHAFTFHVPSAIEQQHYQPSQAERGLQATADHPPAWSVDSRRQCKVLLIICHMDTVVARPLALQHYVQQHWLEPVMTWGDQIHIARLHHQATGKSLLQSQLLTIVSATGNVYEMSKEVSWWHGWWNTVM